MRTSFHSALLAALVLVAGCGREPSARPLNSGERAFETRGVVRQISPDRHLAVIRHEEIPDYMPAMTMELTVRDPKELEGIAPGDSITFRLVATPDAHWIDGIKKITPAAPAPEAAGLAPPTPTGSELKPGDLLPDAELLDEDGNIVRFSDFRGRALAFTFFFTRCPLPDFCPRMNQNFSGARQLLLDRVNAPTNWQFLCVSFDPEFDQPVVLGGYAKVYRGDDADRWRFASASSNVLADLAPRLDLMFSREGGSISHNLRTVVLDPQGRVFRQFDGNQWTAEQLAEALVEAAEPR